jgi:hypothetical protein
LILSPHFGEYFFSSFVTSSRRVTAKPRDNIPSPSDEFVHGWSNGAAIHYSELPRLPRREFSLDVVREINRSLHTFSPLFTRS